MGFLHFMCLSEHIHDLSSEVVRWRNLIKTGGWLMIEVPHRGGHPYVVQDHNLENLHQFTCSSLSCLLERSGFEIISFCSGHFESPVYSDGLRVLARPVLAEDEKRNRLLNRFHEKIPGPFLVYGLGGDFRNYVQPLMDQIAVVGLIDSNLSRHGERLAGFKVEGYDPSRHNHHVILVASLRYEESILASLLASLKAAGHPARSICLLGDIYDDGEQI